jgi:hypothetical protein
MQDYITIGTELADYRVESYIGRGGMAVVYRAEDLRLARPVALKLLAPELSENERFRQRFIQESQMAASIDHPNIIPIYEAGEVEGMLFIAMRYVEGSDLKTVIEQAGALDSRRVAAIFNQVAGALDAAHGRGLVHRDVKPGNILIASGAGSEDPDHVYLTDFGLTKRSSSLSGFTTTGHFIGTIDYIAPEQIQGNPVDGRTDIYALGCVLYQCVVGAPPYQHDEDAAVLWAHLVGETPSVSEHRPDLPPAIDTVLATAMAKAPEDRYQNCREMAAALREALGEPAATTGAGAAPASGPGLPPGLGPALAAPSAPGAGGSRPPVAPPGAAAPAAAAAPGLEPAALPPTADDDSGAVGSYEGYGGYDPYYDNGYGYDAGEAAGGSAVASEPGATPYQAPAAPYAPAAVYQARRRPRLLALLAAIVVLVGGTAAFLALRGDGNPLNDSFTANDLAPFSFHYPKVWKEEEHGTLFMSFSAVDVSELFSSKSWATVDAALQNSPGGVWGMTTRIYLSGFDISDANYGQLENEVKSALPGTAGITDHKIGLKVGGYPAVSLQGQVSDPATSNTLAFVYYVVQVQAQGPETVHLLFFASPSTFGKRLPIFEASVATIQFDPQHF